MLKHVNVYYDNIIKDSVELFKSYCQDYQEQKTRPKTKGIMVKPILTREFKSRVQVNLTRKIQMDHGLPVPRPRLKSPTSY
ncbi:hypothetical protein DPMN_152153 [Dreissena polymorpha]|uniref:Uncharacterized protein n=1 Tax=Dreissena polymorpha TaxID=45954 RepID=A0A9D4FJW0_DREPO|nr:hypothetical protein DPMN_152153 [Dreissena polymorpha]